MPKETTNAKVISDAAKRHIANFIEDFYEPSMLWLLQVHQDAIKIFGKNSQVDTLLHRTPAQGKKRKCVDVEKANALHKESTFHDGKETKKLKIDDLSTILDCSIVDLTTTDENSVNKSRTLRPRKQNISQNAKRSKRQLVKKKNTDVKSIVVSQQFIPPADIDNITLDGSKFSTPVEGSNNTTLQASKVHFSNATLMKITPHKTPQKGVSEMSDGKFFKKIQCHIDFGDELLKDKVTSTPEKKIMVEDTVCSEYSLPLKSDSPEKSEIKTTEGINSAGVCNSPVPAAEPIEYSTHLQNDHASKSNADTPIGECAEEDDTEKPTTKSNSDNNLSPPSPVEHEGDTKQTSEEDKEKENVLEESGRRDTYKIMVDEIIDGHSNKPPLKIDSNKPAVADKDKDSKKVPKGTKSVKTGGNLVTNIKTLIKRPGSPRTEGHMKPGGNVKPSVKHQSPPRKEQPGVVKPGNIATVYSFVKPSPTKKDLGQVAKKAEELEKKELQRQNILKEKEKIKQQQLEEKKRKDEERKRHLAEQQQKMLEEAKKKRLALKEKEAQIAKNQEEIRRAREQEERQKRELRDAKKAELDARRKAEEEELQKKAEELFKDEKRKQEDLRRNKELDEQKRAKKKAEKENLEKDKMRLAEEYRANNEERKKKDYEEKEKHRLEVIKRKEEEREKERLERQIREEKNKQAEKAISDGKKREEERQKLREEEKQREKEKLREEIRRKMALQPKALIDVPTTLRSSPRIKAHTPGKYNGPVVPLVTRDSGYTNYGIDDLDSDDSTDDESKPSKQIPTWAVGYRLKKQLHRQILSNINPADIFIDCNEPLRLEKVFKKNKKIYFTRSSSAHWSTPPIKSAGYNFS